MVVPEGHTQHLQLRGAEPSPSHVLRPSRRVVVYLLSGTRAQTSLEEGNGMCWSSAFKHTGHLRECQGLLCSGNLSQVC